MGGFPDVARPNTDSLGSRAEQSYDPEGRPDPSGLLQIIYDFMEMGRAYQYNNDPPTIHAFLSYDENAEGSISITSLEIWNQSNSYVSSSYISL